jgi:hypothetical protein
VSTPRSRPRSLSLLKHHKVRHAYLSLSHQHSQGLDDGPGCWKTTKKPLQLPSVGTLRLRPRARACVTAFTCRFLRQQVRLYQRRSGCVKPLQKKSCWYLRRRLPICLVTAFPTRMWTELQAMCLLGRRHVSRLANPHTCCV